MSKGGSKKTTQKQNFKLPAWYEDAAKSAIAFSEDISKAGHVPWLGPDVAALAPQTKAGIAGTDAMSAAFGMPTSGGNPYLPPEQEFAGGVKGYSGFGGFEEAMESLKVKYPGMYNFLSQFNKINQGESFNPSQATPIQDTLSPQFNATVNALKPKKDLYAPGSKGPEQVIAKHLYGLGGK